MENATPTGTTVTPAVILTTAPYAQIPEALLYDAAIPAEAVRVYGVLVRYGSKPSNCYPSHRRIAEHIGKSQRSIPAWIRALEEAGWVERFPRFTPEGDPTSNGYAVHAEPRGRATERGVRADERGGVPVPQRGGSAPGGAPIESQGNESQVEGETTRALTLLDAPSEFDIFWNEYPSKSGKGAARTAWGKARKKVAAGTILDGLRVYVASDKVARGVICNPSTWLNQERWDDTPPPPPQSPRQHRKATATAAFVGDERPTGGVGRAFYGEDETNALMRATRQEIR